MIAIPGASEPHEFLIPALAAVFERVLLYCEETLDGMVFRSDGLLNNKNLGVYCAKYLIAKNESPIFVNKNTQQRIDLSEWIEMKRIIVCACSLHLIHI